VLVEHVVHDVAGEVISNGGPTDVAPADGRNRNEDSGPPLARGSVAIILGTRPEAIKLSQVVDLLGPAGLLIPTGQHYSAELWSKVCSDIGMPATASSLAVGGRTRATQIGHAVTAVGSMLRMNDSVRAVVVQGDTNATLAGALAANAEGRAVVHVEAGLRSRDRRMPEEHNRVLVDHLADLCLAPTPQARENLIAEGICPSRVTLTGNTIVEVVRALLPVARVRREVCDRYRVRRGSFVLATLHRPENTDDPLRLATILDDLRALGAPVILPLHPRTRAAVKPGWLDGLHVVESLPPRTFLSLLAESALVVSDSGGIQEEATVLGRPALIVRRSTERPEGLGRWCELVEPGEDLRVAAHARLADVAGWRRRCAIPSPYGDGSASRRIVDAIAALVNASLAERI
jgi:UDP-N-acetylglucosamine 2-epimerase (non-hydrolysing)